MRKTYQWEARSAKRWGSEHAGYFDSKDGAEAHAMKEIKANGAVGGIRTIDEDQRVVYYDTYEELS